MSASPIQSFGLKLAGWLDLIVRWVFCLIAMSLMLLISILSLPIGCSDAIDDAWSVILKAVWKDRT